MNEISFDHRAIAINGRRTLIISGAVHYPRSTPAMWPDIIRRSQLAGLNTIETYVFWNLHERQQGVFDFTGRLDLMRFCQCAHDLGMYVILRIGPYICAETNYGGFPSWLRDVPGIQMRTHNGPFMREVERWIRRLCDYLRPMFAPRGGPIILAQIENEYDLVAKKYGQEGQKYLQWCADLARSLQLGIPWVMCVGSARGAIETINAYYGHEHLAQHRRKHPDQPGLWTEAWAGCYDTWGCAHRRRGVEDMAYAAARFFAAGGTGINYYMWHGGTNFDRETMYLQTTSYDFAAPLDEFGLATTMSLHLARLHKVLIDHESLLVQERAPTNERLGPGQVVYACGEPSRVGPPRASLLFICNDADTPAQVSCQGETYEMAARSVIIADRDGILYDTSEIRPGSLVQRVMDPVDQDLTFRLWPEPMPTQWPAEVRSAVESHDPLEQLQFTHDRTDYCWYTTTLDAQPAQSRGKLVLERAADVVYVFVDAQLAATTQGPLAEDRGRLDGDGYCQAFDLDLPAGQHELSILCCSLGLVKGDWMIGDMNMAEERKGLWGCVRWNGRVVRGWRIQPGLLGEAQRVFDAAHDAARWQLTGEPPGRKSLCWLRTGFTRPAGDAPLALDLAGMGKGLIWLNGLCGGRYWLAAGTGRAPPWARVAIVDNRVGEPTQRYYHLPSEWLLDRNVLVLFEELGGDPTTVRLCRWSETGRES